MNINGITPLQAAQDAKSMALYLQSLSDMVAGVVTAAGANNPAKPTAAPAAAAWSVSNKDGVFIIDIVPPQIAVPASIVLHIQQVTQVGQPNPTGAAIYYQLQSSTDTNWDTTGKVKTYGSDTGDTRLHWEIRDPNQTKFWRFRSKYQNSNWSQWLTWSDPQFCGPVAVWSGLLRSASIVMLNSQAQTTDGSNALSQVGVTTVIAVAGKNWNVGPVVITYAGGSVDPGSYGTFYIYAIDIEKAGGVVTYLSTTNVGVLASQDGLIAFGFITTSAGGGGTGGGGGSCHVAGTMLEMFDGSFKDCSLIQKGDELLGCDGGKEVAQADAEAVPNVPCFAPEFANGVKLENGVSSSEPIMLADGLFTSVFNSLVGQSFKTRIGNSILTAKPFIGNRTVWRQRLDRTKTFWADRLGSHNMKPA